MTLRARHGNSKRYGVGPVVETLPPDEQPPAVNGAPIIRDKGRVTDSAGASALAKLPRRGRNVPAKIAVHPKFATHNRNRIAWTKGRRDEIQSAHGGVSRGVGALLVAGGWLHAAGECAAEIAAETLDWELFKTAGSLTTTARNHELAAWELAAREAEVHRQQRGWVDPLDAYMPQQQESTNGNEDNEDDK